MILFNTDFGDDFGDNPTPPLDGPAFHLDPFYLLGGAVIIGIVVGIVAAVMYLARNRAERRVRTDCEASAKAIYDCVKYHLDRALRAPGSAIIDRGREVADVLEARLGAVLALDGRVGKPFGDLAKALKGEKPKARPEGPAKVKVHRSTDDHAYQVWNALQALNAFWSDRPRVEALLVAAQKELVTMPAPLPVTAAVRPGFKLPEKVEKAKAKTHQSLWDEIPDTRREAKKKKPKPIKVSKPIKVPEPIVMPKPVAKDDGPPDPPPPPPAPRPSGKRKKDLPAHKRNMLA
jgi:hypothetical protein